MNLLNTWYVRGSMSAFLLYLLINFCKHSLVYRNVAQVTATIQSIHKVQDGLLNVQGIANSKLRQQSLKRDLKKYYHPDTVLEDFYIYRTQMRNDTLRDYLQTTLFDSQPYHRTFRVGGLREYFNRTFSDFTSIWMIAHSKPRKDLYQTYGLFERNQHFPTPLDLNNKITLAQLLQARIDKFKTQKKSGQCLKDAQFQKKSYESLNNTAQCYSFFRLANQEYLTNSTNEVYSYVKKTNQHDQLGTELVLRSVFNRVSKRYQGGRTCNQPQTETVIMQEYIKNPLLLEGRKFDIRLHMIITSLNPPIMYLYKTFYLMKCAYPFDYNEFRNQSHICSAGYQRRLHYALRDKNDTEELEKILPFHEITEAVTYDELARRLLKEGKIKDMSWVEDHMIPEMERKFYHFLQSYFDKSGSIDDLRIGEYSACEFDIDDQMGFWLLECTPNPNLVPQGPGRMMNFQTQLHKDGIPIVMAYARQKYRRIKHLIQKNLKNTKVLDRDVQSAMKETVISDNKIDSAFHRIDFKRAAKSCQ